jgi:hypothetical protein
MEGRNLGRRLDGLVRSPDTAVNVRQDVAQLGLGALPRPAVLSGTEGDVSALAISAEADRPRAAILWRDHLPGRSAGHQASPPVLRCECMGASTSCARGRALQPSRPPLVGGPALAVLRDRDKCLGPAGSSLALSETPCSWPSLDRGKP